MRGIGQPWRDRVCLVGGLAPLYLVPNVGYQQPAYVGSGDVDVALRIAVDSNDEGAYATLETNLKRMGFKRWEELSWRWYATLDGGTVILELLGDAPDAMPGDGFRPRVTPPAGAGGVGLLCVRGVELVFKDLIRVEREVLLLSGAVATVRFNVANLAPFVALKADAHLDRDKPKDAYDLVYVLRWWPDGVERAAEAVAASPVFDEPFVQSALARIGPDFAQPTHLGAVNYATIAALGGSASERAGAANEAVLVMRRFLDALGIA
jgi:hypothetical protein